MSKYYDNTIPLFTPPHVKQLCKLIAGLRPTPAHPASPESRGSALFQMHQAFASF
jgi:hypothetical protein